MSKSKLFLNQITKLIEQGIYSYKDLSNECKCIHCQQKLEQINNSRTYWCKLILNKN